MNTPDVFVANKSYPDAAGIFYNDYETLDDVRAHCIVVLDTNALLVPYRISKSSISQIKSTYAPLAAANRLIIPGQVAREFVKNRPMRIAEIFQALTRKKAVQGFWKGQYPLLEEAPGYVHFQNLEKQIDDLIREYKKSVDGLIDHVRSWNWNDPVSKLYSEMFPALVVDLDFDEEEIGKHLEYQRINKLPPGYKDGAKDDGGIGDQLIWQVVLKIARERKKPIVFVSGDTKADWFYRSEKQPLYPRFELVDQIRRETDGKGLYIIPFSEFLELFGATEDTVGEVREEEIKEFSSSNPVGGRSTFELESSNTFGKMLRDYRQNVLGITTHELSSRLDHAYDRTTIAKYELGERKPSGRFLFHLQDALGIPEDIIEIWLEVLASDTFLNLYTEYKHYQK